MAPGIWLGIETGSSGGGAALLSADGRVLGEIIPPAGAVGSEILLPAIHDLLSATETAPADIAGIGVSLGPGSYTGLRIGVSTALGLSAGWGVGVKGVSALRVLACQTASDGPVAAVLRAREGEVFGAVFASGDPFSEALVAEGVYEAAALDGACRRLGVAAIAGSGRSEMSFEAAPGVPAGSDSPRPSTVAVVARLLFARTGFDATLSPVYLRSFSQKASSVVP